MKIGKMLLGGMIGASLFFGGEIKGRAEDSSLGFWEKQVYTSQYNTDAEPGMYELVRQKKPTLAEFLVLGLGVGALLLEGKYALRRPRNSLNHNVGRYGELR